MIKKVFHESNGDTSVFVYIPHFLDRQKSKDIHNWLDKKTYRQAHTHWNNSSIREQLWFQEDDKYFCEKWNKRFERWESNKYDINLKELQNNVQCALANIDLNFNNIQRPTINSVLINKYRDENDNIKPHRDTELTFGKNPTIIGLSIGETRKLKVRRLIYDQDNPHLFVYDDTNIDKNFDIGLENGSLFIMAGSSQKYFSHEIPKENFPCKERYSLTFREVI